MECIHPPPAQIHLWTTVSNWWGALCCSQLFRKAPGLCVRCLQSSSALQTNKQKSVMEGTGGNICSTGRERERFCYNFSANLEITNCARESTSCPVLGQGKECWENGKPGFDLLPPPFVFPVGRNCLVGIWGAHLLEDACFVFLFEWIAGGWGSPQTWLIRRQAVWVGSAGLSSLFLGWEKERKKGGMVESITFSAKEKAGLLGGEKE